jgi:putative ABC transport system substrate-binding protein
MRRRDFIALIGGAAAAWPMGAHAQETGRIYRLGALTGAARASPRIVGFFDELKTLGFVEGQNLEIVVAGFDLRDDEFAKVGATLTKAAPDAVVCVGVGAARAAQEAVRTTPIVVMSTDLVAEGLVVSLNRPGGNINGISIFPSDLDGKRQEILMDALPRTAAHGRAREPKHHPSSHSRTALTCEESIWQPLQQARLIRSHRRWTRPRRQGPLH